MLFTAIASSLVLAASALAQNTPAGFTPTSNQTLDVYYGTTYISPGLMVKKSSVQSKPTIGVTGLEVSGKYLLAMIDIDVQQGGGRTTVLHALLQDYTPSGQTQNGTTVLTTTATTPSSYFGPAPPAENPKHPHNYIFLLHKQPDGFAVPSAHRQAVSSRFGIDWNKFVTDAKLSPPVAANYLQVQSGDNTLKGRKL